MMAPSSDTTIHWRRRERPTTGSPPWQRLGWSGGDGAKLNTGWAIVVQEEVQQTLSPLEKLRSLFLYSGLGALALAALIIGGMWWIVLLVANAPGRLRSLRFWGRTAALHSLNSVADSVRRRETGTLVSEKKITSETRCLNWLPRVS
jgi:hypothetical protein